METAIRNQIGDAPPEQVTELVLDTCKATKVTGLDKFTHLKSLTLNACGLTTLEGFPALPQLLRLELSDNNLCDGLEALQDAGLVALKSLSLAGNKFATIESLEPLGSLPGLRDLDLFNCSVTETDGYRSGVFDLLPALKYLDGFDADDNEKEDEDEDGDLDDDDEEDDGLLDSELGEDDGDLGEDDDDDVDAQTEDSYDDGLGESDAYGEEDGEDDGEEDELGEDDGEEEYGEDDGEEGDEDEGGGEEDEFQAKRQKR